MGAGLSGTRNSGSGTRSLGHGAREHVKPELGDSELGNSDSGPEFGGSKPGNSELDNSELGNTVARNPATQSLKRALGGSIRPDWARCREQAERKPPMNQKFGGLARRRWGQFLVLTKKRAGPIVRRAFSSEAINKPLLKATQMLKNASWLQWGQWFEAFLGHHAFSIDFH